MTGLTAGAGHSRFEDVVEHLGARICSGELAPGDVVVTDQVEAATSTSRSVVREAIRVLSALGLLQSRRRVGAVVLPADSWNLFDARVLRWSLSSGRRPELIRSLIEMRLAIEPQAAALAAGNADPDSAARLLEVAGLLWSSAASGDVDSFLVADARFHEIILDSSGNPLFRRLSGFVTEALRGQTLEQLRAQPLDLAHVHLHLDLARAIQGGHPGEAADLARRIVLDAASSLAGRVGRGG